MRPYPEALIHKCASDCALWAELMHEHGAGPDPDVREPNPKAQPGSAKVGVFFDLELSRRVGVTQSIAVKSELIAVVGAPAFNRCAT